MQPLRSAATGGRGRGGVGPRGAREGASFVATCALGWAKGVWWTTWSQSAGMDPGLAPMSKHKAKSKEEILLQLPSPDPELLGALKSRTGSVALGHCLRACSKLF